MAREVVLLVALVACGAEAEVAEDGASLGAARPCPRGFRPGAVARVWVTAASPGAVSLAWTPAFGEGYRVTRDGVQLARREAARTDFVDRAATPATAYSYEVAAIDTCGVSGRPARVALTTPPADPAIAGQTIFGDAPPSNATVSTDTRPTEPALAFVPRVHGLLTAVRFHRGVPGGGPFNVTLRDASGALLGTATVATAAAAGWQSVPLATPVRVARGARYTAAYSAPAGRATETPGLLLHAIHTGALEVPAIAPPATHRWVDVRFTPLEPLLPPPATESILGGAAPASVTFLGAPATMGTRFRSDVDGEASAVRFFRMNTAQTPPTAVQLWSNDGDLLASAPVPPSPQVGWNDVRLPAAVPIRAGWFYVASYTSSGYVPFTPRAWFDAHRNGRITGLADGTEGRNGVYDCRGTAFPTCAFDAGNYWADVAITPTAGAPSPYSVWGGYTPTAYAIIQDTQPMELGVKLTSAASGELRAVRFFRGVQNGAPYTVSVWSPAGACLGRGTGPDATGWVEVPLAAPVRVRPGVTYVASYHASQGRPAYTHLGFSRDWSYTTRDLTIPASATSGGNGVYRFTPTPAFPTATIEHANYWVDVAFAPDP